MLSENDLNLISNKVIGCAIEVHRVLGPGLLESAYQKCLAWELRQGGLLTEEQVPISIQYKNIALDNAYRLDLLIENGLIVELKSAESLEPVHVAQMLTYLKVTRLRLGLLLNFNVDVMRKGIKRVVNNL